MDEELKFTKDNLRDISYALSEALASFKRSKKHQKEHITHPCLICARYIKLEKKIEKYLHKEYRKFRYSK